jgi:hypothetical protein
MQTVVFDFEFQNVYKENPIVFAQKLLRINPSKCECTMFGDRAYMRLWWDRNSAAYASLVD